MPSPSIINIMFRFDDCQRSSQENVNNVTENMIIAMDGNNIRHDSVELRTTTTAALTIVGK